MRHLLWLWLTVALLLAPPARADEPTLEQAKASFQAGAAAYAAGDYLAAIQALEAAYRATPLPAIAFSLAQAERRQYFVSQETPYLARAIELYRTYLAQVPRGGRRADAADALAQLEPIARALPAAADGTPAIPRAPGAEKTRLLVSGRARGARVSLDGGTPVDSPLIAEVTPGPHRVHVEAEGFFSEERQVVALEGVLVPADVELRERPAVVVLRGATGGDVYVDDHFVGRAKKELSLQLSSGAHRFVVAKSGREVERVSVSLARGERRVINVSFRNTSQRTTSLILFGSGAAVAGLGVSLGIDALDAEAEAAKILRKRDSQGITPAELDSYRDFARQRNQYRTGSIVTLILGGAALATGLTLFLLDEPLVAEAERPTGDRAPTLGLEAASEGVGLQGRLRF
jgi:hypothetical protein